MKILFTGTNLKGETVEFGDTESNIELASLALLFFPIAKVGKAGTKIAEKAGTKGFFNVAGRRCIAQGHTAI